MAQAPAEYTPKAQPKRNPAYDWVYPVCLRQTVTDPQKENPDLPQQRVVSLPICTRPCQIMGVPRVVVFRGPPKGEPKNE